MHEKKAFVFRDLALCLMRAGRGHMGGVRYTYIHSYTHGVKLNVNLFNMTNIVRYLAVPPTDHLSRYPKPYYVLKYSEICNIYITLC